MSENTGPTIPRFSEMFRFGDDSDLNEHLRELRAEAFACGFWLELEVQPKGKFSPDKLPSLPKRAQEILHELLSKHYLRMCEAMDDARRARGEKLIGDPKKLAKRQADFEKAYYAKLRHSEKRRRIVDLLRAWHGGLIVEECGWCRRADQERMPLLAPLLNAVRALDTDFFKLLAEATEMLEKRIRSSKDPTIGTGDTQIDLWSLQYGMRIAGTATHTVRELNEERVSKFHTMSDKDLRKRCQYLVIPLKPDKRGTAAVRYGRGAVQMSPQRTQKGLIDQNKWV